MKYLIGWILGMVGAFSGGLESVGVQTVPEKRILFTFLTVRPISGADFPTLTVSDTLIRKGVLKSSRARSAAVPWKFIFTDADGQPTDTVLADGPSSLHFEYSPQPGSMTRTEIPVPETALTLRSKYSGKCALLKIWAWNPKNNQYVPLPVLKLGSNRK